MTPEWETDRSLVSPHLETWDDERSSPSPLSSGFTPQNDSAPTSPRPSAAKTTAEGPKLTLEGRRVARRLLGESVAPDIDNRRGG